MLRGPPLALARDFARGIELAPALSADVILPRIANKSPPELITLAGLFRRWLARRAGPQSMVFATQVNLIPRRPLLDRMSKQ